MIIYKRWLKRSKGGLKREVCEGWFLFGIMPLYIKCIDIDLPNA